MDQLRPIEHVARSLIEFQARYADLIAQFGRAHARLRELSAQPGRGQRIGLHIGDIADNQFDVEYCDLKLRVRFVAEMRDAAGAARGRVDFLAVIKDPNNPEILVDAVTFTRSGETPVLDADGDPADIEECMIDFVLQVIGRLLASRGEAAVA